MANKERSETFSPKHQQLIWACKRGDQKAQFEIYRLYHVAMYNTTLRIVGDPDDAEDVMQEAFLKAFTKLKTYRGEVSFGAWLKRIMINKALDFLRLKRERISLDEVGEIEESQDDPPEMMETEYMAETIKRAIYSLPEGYRIVLSLILLEGYDHEEVSGILNISNATSRTQYHRAKKKLLELLTKTEEDNG
ncbi:MAG: RNA polymerase sigma factor [Bacteroidales bacterium]|nr:RNA polymerase sigma factor [Bacteroidales bacterium]